MKLKDNRGLFVTILLSIITLGIYDLYLYHVLARDTNIACEGDGKKTAGLIAQILLGLITLGIYNLVWSCMAISRWETCCYNNGQKARLSVGGFLLWTFIGSLIIVGPFIAMYKFIHSFDDVCRIYNSKLEIAPAMAA